METKFEDRENDAQEVEQLKREYENQIQKSSLGKAERELSLRYIRGGKNYEGKPFTAESLKNDLKGLRAFEIAQDRAIKAYDAKIARFARKGLFSKDPKRQQDYRDWFRDRPYDDPSAPIDKKRALKKCDLNRQERVDVLKLWKQLPSAVRSKNKQKFEYENDLEENQKFVGDLFARHSALKERFLKLPKKVQEEFRKPFKKLGDFDEREALLKRIEVERKRLIDDYRAKIEDMQKPDENGLTLFSDISAKTAGSSAAKYIEWFENLSVGKMAHMLANSSLENPKRGECCEDMARILPQLPPEEQSKIRQEFNASELTGRQTIVAKYGKFLPEKENEKSPDAKKTQDWIQREARKELLARCPDKLTAAFESYTIEEETLTRRERAQREYHAHTVEGLKEAAAAHDVKKAEDDTSALEKKAVNLNEEDDLTLKRRELREKRDIRYGLVRKLRSKVDDQHAKLLGVHYVSDSGNELYTEEARKTELTALQKEVQERLAPVLQLRSREQGLNIDEKTLEKGLDDVDLKSTSREYLRKAA